MDDSVIVHAVAVSVMGWHPVEEDGVTVAYFQPEPKHLYVVGGWDPLTRDADTCAVLRKMRQKDYRYRLVESEEGATCMFSRRYIKKIDLRVTNEGGFEMTVDTTVPTNEWDLPVSVELHHRDWHYAVAGAALKAVGVLKHDSRL